MNVPVQVAGSFLYCEETDTVAKFIAVIGCRVNADDGSKLEIGEDLQLDFSYTAAGAKETIAVVAQDAVSRYHVKYFFESELEKTTRELAARTKYQVQVSRKDAGPVQLSMSGTDFFKVDASPQVSSGLWVRDPVSDRDSDGTCNGSEDCVYIENASILWTSVVLSSATANEAASSCADLEFGAYSNWSLASASEWDDAHDDDIRDLSGLLSASVADVWTDAAVSSTGPTADVFDFGTGSIIQRGVDSVSSVVCHRHIQTFD